MSETSDSTARLAAFLLGLPRAPSEPTISARRAAPIGDAFLGDAGAGGERLVAHVRLLVATALSVVQVVLGAAGGREVATLLSGAFWLAAAAVYLLVSHRYRPWLAVLSCALDVTVVSAALAVFALTGAPGGEGTGGFELYFLAIGCAGLRYDWRLLGLTGVLALGQYASLVAAAPAWLGREAAASLVRSAPERLLMLGAATLVSAAVVVRARQLRHLSTTDPLTGLSNRAVFDERLAGESSRSFRHGRPYAVAILDVDRFKRFNDSHGHAAGDAALRVVAEALRGAVRESDVVARLGGEEFALIFPETTPEAALLKVDAIRRAVSDTAIEVRGRWMPQYLTVSAGVAGWPDDDGLDGSEILARADERLYEAKARGRDRVIGPAA